MNGNREPKLFPPLLILHQSAQSNSGRRGAKDLQQNQESATLLQFYSWRFGHEDGMDTLLDQPPPSRSIK